MFASLIENRGQMRDVILKNNILWRTDGDGSTSRPVSAAEYWDERSSDYESEDGFQLSGFGELGLRGVLEESGPRVAVTAHCSLGIFPLPANAGPISDHVVADGVWIPLRQDEVKDFAQQLSESAVSTASPTTSANYAKAVTLASQEGLKFSLQDGFEEALRAKSTRHEIPALLVEPYPYQQTGIGWMAGLFDENCGALLADQMGLGKTLQLIGLIAHAIEQDEQGARVLVVVPSSLKLNWCSEFIKFADIHDIHVHSGPDRPTRLRDISSHTVTLITYDTLIRDSYLFERLEFSLVICDEAHWLKNSGTAKWGAVNQLRARAKFLATGTPVQNRLLDMWAMMEIVRPGILGSREVFSVAVRDTPDEARNMGERVAPLILRRTGEMVNLQLPEKIEMTVPLELSEQDRAELFELSQGRHEETMGLKGRETFQKQRSFCAATGIFQSPPSPARGGKADYLVGELRNIQAAGEKALLFVADLVRPAEVIAQLIRDNFPGEFVRTVNGNSGGADIRFSIIDEFSAIPGFAVLIINPTVGGEGLNITSANHVIHVTPAWNPAKRDQATFRVVRPGQRRTTYVKHLYYVQSIEERMMAVLAAKQELSDETLIAAENRSNSISGM
jgi:SNF2 family DNA or RNA helicase